MLGLKSDLFKQSLEKEQLSSDLFFQLSYMSAIAGAGISRAQIFERASQLPWVNCC